MAALSEMLIPIPEEMDERYLETVSNALTEQMRGKTIQDLPQVVERLRGQVKNGEGVFRSLIESDATKTNRKKMRSIVFDNTKNLFKHQEYNNLERAQNFLAAMDTRELFYDMLSQAQQMQIHISIGSENEDESLKGFLHRNRHLFRRRAAVRVVWRHRADAYELRARLGHHELPDPVHGPNAGRSQDRE